ncbi:hypothetical protein HK102_008209 [Quaeritorhiza haematococci]|nr:hypothetical protein HK102_008209 [Quaeritorhiza haematococci]
MCLSILHGLQRHQDAGAFLFPFDPLAWDLQGESHVSVEKPVDLQTIETRLLSSASSSGVAAAGATHQQGSQLVAPTASNTSVPHQIYRSVDDFIADLRLMFANAKKYFGNNPSSSAHKQAKALEDFLDWQLTKGEQKVESLAAASTPPESEISTPSPIEPSITRTTNTVVRKRGRRQTLGRHADQKSGENGPQDQKLHPKATKQSEPTNMLDKDLISSNEPQQQQDSLVAGASTSPSTKASQDTTVDKSLPEKRGKRRRIAPPDIAPVADPKPTLEPKNIVQPLPLESPSPPSSPSLTSAPPITTSDPTTRTTTGGKTCSYCKTRSTPMWRHGPPSFSLLCNSCGVKWSRGRILEQFKRPPKSRSSSSTAKQSSSTSRRSKSHIVKIKTAARSEGEQAASEHATSIIDGEASNFLDETAAQTSSDVDILIDSAHVSICESIEGEEVVDHFDEPLETASVASWFSASTLSSLSRCSSLSSVSSMESVIGDSVQSDSVEFETVFGGCGPVNECGSIDGVHTSDGETEQPLEGDTQFDAEMAVEKREDPEDATKHQQLSSEPNQSEEREADGVNPNSTSMVSEEIRVDVDVETSREAAVIQSENKEDPAKGEKEKEEDIDAMMESMVDLESSQLADTAVIDETGIHPFGGQEHPAEHDATCTSHELDLEKAPTTHIDPLLFPTRSSNADLIESDSFASEKSDCLSVMDVLETELEESSRLCSLDGGQVSLQQHEAAREAAEVDSATNVIKMETEEDVVLFAGPKVDENAVDAPLAANAEVAVVSPATDESRPRDAGDMTMAVDTTESVMESSRNQVAGMATPSTLTRQFEILSMSSPSSILSAPTTPTTPTGGVGARRKQRGWWRKSKRLQAQQQQQQQQQPKSPSTPKTAVLPSEPATPLPFQESPPPCTILVAAAAESTPVLANENCHEPSAGSDEKTIEVSDAEEKRGEVVAVYDVVMQEGEHRDGDREDGGATKTMMDGINGNAIVPHVRECCESGDQGAVGMDAKTEEDASGSCVSDEISESIISTSTSMAPASDQELPHSIELVVKVVPVSPTTSKDVRSGNQGTSREESIVSSKPGTPTARPVAKKAPRSAIRFNTNSVTTTPTTTTAAPSILTSEAKTAFLATHVPALPQQHFRKLIDIFMSNANNNKSKAVRNSDTKVPDEGVSSTDGEDFELNVKDLGEEAWKEIVDVVVAGRLLVGAQMGSMVGARGGDLVANEEFVNWSRNSRWDMKIGSSQL